MVEVCIILIHQIELAFHLIDNDKQRENKANLIKRNWSGFCYVTTKNSSLSMAN